jgi:transmembrane 9 superfamily protein 2/4
LVAGFRLGFTKDGKSYINNHLKLILSYHKDDTDPTNEIYRVVGFRVETSSVDLKDLDLKEGGKCAIKENHNYQEVAKEAQTELYFTYSVEWQPSDIR